MTETAPQLKRFETYPEAFAYFLKTIAYEDTIKRTLRKKTRIALYLEEIMNISIKRFPWKRNNDGNEIMVLNKDKDTYFKTSISFADILKYTTWENMDFIIRQVNARNSGLPKRLRDSVMYILNWTDHFIEKEEVIESNIE